MPLQLGTLIALEIINALHRNAGEYRGQVVIYSYFVNV